jgi:hypothetical protein
VDKITTDFGNVFLWTFWIFVVIGAITIWVLAIVDLFGDDTLSGWAKVGWALVLILVPWLGVLVYWVVRDQRVRKLRKDLQTES